ncbi:phosphate-import permease protein PhnE [bacterium BMS3Bbin10]|nr:phosphate-import permease protein PhnE [bacterium BMS3Bbin10]HDL16670.1 phosphonate ABC transporter, permease protein PhnE [Hyphomicrobiales bacterium]
MASASTTARNVDRILAARTKAKFGRSIIYAAVIAMAVFSIKTTIIDDTDWARLGSVANVLASAAEFLGVDWGLLPNLLEPAIETIMVATLGTLLGVVVCVPAIWFGALNITPFTPVTYPLARLMMTLSRSIHEIVWGLFFVAAVGLGALAGVLALAIRSVGFIAKMSAEAIEDLDPNPVEAIRAVGGSDFQVFIYAILPQVLPVIVGVVIFEWEINIRRSSILGLVGAGGLGLVFFRQLNTFNFPGVTTVILAILALILFGEIVSYYVRKAII